MRLSTLTAIAALFAVGSASALVVPTYTVDDFNDNDPITSLTYDNRSGNTTGDGTSQGVFGTTGNHFSQFANSAGLFRAVEHVITVPSTSVICPAAQVGTGTCTNTNDGGSLSVVRIGPLAFPQGTMTIANQNSFNSITRLAWTLPAGFIPSTASGPASLLFNLLFADSGINFKLFYNNVQIGSDSLPADPLDGGGNNVALQAQFDLAAGAQNAINAGTGNRVLLLEITGATGFDLSLDSVGFVVPEPTSLALVGLGLVGAGLASRRRKA